MNVLAALKGQGPRGLGKGLTTYPASNDPEQKAAHAECLKLEREGLAVRYMDHDGQGHPHGAPFIIWHPAADEPGGSAFAPEEPPKVFASEQARDEFDRRQAKLKRLREGRQADASPVHEVDAP